MFEYDSTSNDWYQIWPDQKSSNQLYRNQIWPPIAWMDWEAQMEAEWEANGGLMGMMGMTGECTIANAQFDGHDENQCWFNNIILTGNCNVPSMWLLSQATTWSKWCRWWRWRLTASAPPPTWPTARWPCPPWPLLAGSRQKTMGSPKMLHFGSFLGPNAGLFRALLRPTKDCKVGSLAASLASINICIVVRHHCCLAGNNSPFSYLRVYLSNLIQNFKYTWFSQTVSL